MPLSNDCLERLRPEVGVELCPVGADHAVRRPAVDEVRVRGEVRRRVDVPVAGGDDDGVLALLGFGLRANGAARSRSGTRLRATAERRRHRPRRSRLHVDDDECARLMVLSPPRRLWGSWARPATAAKPLRELGARLPCRRVRAAERPRRRRLAVAASRRPGAAVVPVVGRHARPDADDLGLRDAVSVEPAQRPLAAADLVLSLRSSSRPG